MLAVRTLLALSLTSGDALIAPGTLDLEPDRSEQPLAFRIEGADAALFEVTVPADVTRVELAAPDGSIIGAGHETQRDETANTATITLRLAIAPPREPLAMAGAFEFRFHRGSELCETRTARIELFLLPPEADMTFAPRGVPLEILRDLTAFAAGPTVGLSPALPWAESVNRVFQGNPPRYDIFQGAPHYTTNTLNMDRLTFHQRRYLAARSDPRSLINCYDAAAYLQVLLRAGGYKPRYLFMKPFGYLRRTNLIGRGPTNNPFTKGTAPAVTRTDDPNRTSFGNHAFCAVRTANDQVYVIDACAGPHPGESAQSYVDTAVDDQVPDRPRTPRGRLNDIDDFDGVTNISNLASPGAEMSAFIMPETTRDPFKDDRDAFIAAVAYTPEARFVDVLPLSVPEATDCPALAGMSLLYRDTALGYPESNREWRFVGHEASVTIGLFAHHSSEGAHERFLLLGSVHHADEPIYVKGLAGLGDVSAQSFHSEQQVLLWVDGNLVIRLEVNGTGVEALDIARWLEARMRIASDAQHLSPPPPLKLTARAARPSVRIGDEIRVDIEAPADAEIDFVLAGEADYLGRSEQSLRFRARKEGTLAISVIAADPRTLIADQTTETIRVVG